MKIHLREKRDEKKMSLEQLSMLSGVSKTHINDIENEITTPTITVILHIAKALNVDLMELIEE